MNLSDIQEWLDKQGDITEYASPSQAYLSADLSDEHTEDVFQQGVYQPSFLANDPLPVNTAGQIFDADPFFQTASQAEPHGAYGYAMPDFPQPLVALPWSTPSTLTMVGHPTRQAGSHDYETPTKGRPRVSKEWPCALCDSMHQSPSNRKTHARDLHSQDKPWSCAICALEGKTRAYPRHASCVRHIKDTHGNPEDPAQYVIEDAALANLTYEEIIARAQAADVAAASALLALRAQPYSTSDMIDLTGSPEQVTAEQFPCTWCSEVFTTADILQLHNHADHHFGGSLNCGCSVCIVARAGIPEEDLMLAESLYSMPEDVLQFDFMDES